MAKTPEERGPIGRWLIDERRKRDWNSAALARAGLERANVLRVATSVYAEWEAGTKRPNAAQMEALTRFYGSEPTRPATDPDMSALVQAMVLALNEQAKAMAALRVAFLDASARADEQRDTITDLLASLDVRLRALEPAASTEAGSVVRGSARQGRA